MKVLVADDNNLITELLRRSLVPLDWQIEVFTDSTSLVECIGASEEPLVVMVDMEFPGVSGVEIAMRFAGRHPEHAVFVILVTMRCDPVAIEEGFYAGAVDVLVLPADEQVIRARAYAASRTMQKMAAMAVTAQRAAPEKAVVATEPNIRISGSNISNKFVKFTAISKARDYIMEAIVGMGFDRARAIEQHGFALTEPSYASWCCIVAPSCGVWVDVLIETDRNVAMDLFEKLTGVPADCAKDATDTLGEIANLVQGGIKSALQAEGHDTITPVVPKPVPANSLRKLNERVSDRVRVVVDFSGLVFSVTLFVFSRPMVRKTIEALRQRDVTAEALPMPHGVDLKMLNRGVMLDDRWITNLRNRFMGSNLRLSCNVVEPSPLINLLTGISIKADT